MRHLLSVLLLGLLLAGCNAPLTPEPTAPAPTATRWVIVVTATHTAVSPSTPTLSPSAAPTEALPEPTAGAVYPGGYTAHVVGDIPVSLLSDPLYPRLIGLLEPGTVAEVKRIYTPTSRDRWLYLRLPNGAQGWVQAIVDGAVVVEIKED